MMHPTKRQKRKKKQRKQNEAKTARLHHDCCYPVIQKIASKESARHPVCALDWSKKYNPMHFINKQKSVHNILCMCQKKHISHISKSHPKPSKTNLAVLALINPSTSLSGSWRTRKSHSGGRRRYHLDGKVGGVCQYSWYHDLVGGWATQFETHICQTKV